MSTRKTVPCLTSGSFIRLRGARQNNLQGIDLDLPHGQFIVITGVSGSGKSSLAFDTLFAEGQRRFIETFSPYARQFFDRMDKPAADLIEGMPPAIAIEQRNAVRTTRSTVGTLTEICDYAKLVWFHLARLHCHRCGRLVRQEPPSLIWDELNHLPTRSDPGRAAGDSSGNREVLVTFQLPFSKKLSVAESFDLIEKQGYQRLLLPTRDPTSTAPGAGRVLRIEDAAESFREREPESVILVQDRCRLSDGQRGRLVEACEQAYHFGQGRLAVYHLGADSTAAELVLVSRRAFSHRRHCAECDLDYPEPSPALFSFNHPAGACPACRGFGRIIGIDFQRVLPDTSKTLAEGVVRPWRTGFSAECQEDLLRFCRKRKVPIDVPFAQLTDEWREWVIEGDPGYGQDARHEWPRAWYGVKGYFKWLESKAYKMHVRVLLSRYRVYSTCPQCLGQRFRPESRLYRVYPKEDRAGVSTLDGQGSGGLSLADFYRMPVRSALAWIERLAAGYRAPARDALKLTLEEVGSRLRFLDEVGLGYLTLDRPTRTLSGGETERVNLTACLGTRLVNTLYVLDEPTVGLHARDTDRLIRVIRKLRDMGNTVVVVEHEARVILAGDQIVDLGPQAGEAGGRVIFHGSPRDILRDRGSLTGQYLAGRRRIPASRRREVRTAESDGSDGVVIQDAKLVLGPVTRHNLKNLTIEIPLHRLVCLTGVSGSGKTTVIREALVPALQARMKSEGAATDEDGAEPETESPEHLTSNPAMVLEGGSQVGQVILVDQSSLGKTPRSNPAVYIGAFDHLRELYALTELARQRGLEAGAFSFNSAQGQCERCRGAGFEKIEMQFLSDVFVRCPDCQGRRYRPHILEIKLSPSAVSGRVAAKKSSPRRQKPLVPGGVDSTGAAEVMAGGSVWDWSIADLLAATVDEAMRFLSALPEIRPALRARQKLRWLQDVGLGYLRLGQPLNTLSGGESQRLKLVRHLAEFERQAGDRTASALFLFDEPTTGLHFADVGVLLRVFQRMVDAGHSVVVIEHNLEVIRNADWVIDLGPEAGDGGGRLVVAGTPEMVAACRQSHTGQALREMAL